MAGPFIDDFPIKTSIYVGFSMAMLNNQMVATLAESVPAITLLAPGPGRCEPFRTKKCYVDCIESTKLQCCYTGKWHSAWTSLSPEIKSAAFGTARPICNSSNLNHFHTGRKLRIMFWKTAMRDLSQKVSKV